MTDDTGESVQVDVQVACTNGSVPAEAEIAGWIRRAVAEVDVNEPVEVSVRIVDEVESRNLNRQYRDRDYATNVLSFPGGDGPSCSGSRLNRVRRPSITGPTCSFMAPCTCSDSTMHWSPRQPGWRQWKRKFSHPVVWEILMPRDRTNCQNPDFGELLQYPGAFSVAGRRRHRTFSTRQGQ